MKYIRIFAPLNYENENPIILLKTTQMVADFVFIFSNDQPSIFFVCTRNNRKYSRSIGDASQFFR